jgi:hypothetical protein
MRDAVLHVRSMSKATLRRLAAVKIRYTVQSLFSVPFPPFREKWREAWTFRISRLMDQKPIVLYLRMKGMALALDAIHDDLVRTLGKDAVAYSMVTKYDRSAQFSRRKEATLPKLQMWDAVLSMRKYSRLLPNFRFRLCASFRGGSVFRDPPCTGASRNHFASRCDIFDRSPTF